MPTGCRPQKERAGRLRARADPLVSAGDQAHCDEAGAAAHPPISRHCMVSLAARSPSRRTRGAYQTKTATVMLDDGISLAQAPEPTASSWVSGNNLATHSTLPEI